MRSEDGRPWFRNADRDLAAGVKPFGLMARATIIAALILLLIGKANPAAIEPLRAAVVTPVSSALAVMAGSLHALVVTVSSSASQFARRNLATSELAPVIVSAEGSAQAARLDALERENTALRKLILMAGNRAYKVRSVAVIGGSSTGAGSKLLVAAGREDGIKPGYPVMMGDRVAGRVHHVHGATAIVARLSDRLSRVPVMVGGSETRALLVGTGDGAGALELIEPGRTTGVGDHVTTSGIGGVFPRGLIIGHVASVGLGPPRVSIDSEAAYDSVVGVLEIEGAIFDQPQAGNALVPARSAAATFKQAGRNVSPSEKMRDTMRDTMPDGMPGSMPGTMRGTARQEARP